MLGEIKLIREIVQHVQKKVKTDGLQYFGLNQDKTNASDATDCLKIVGQAINTQIEANGSAAIKEEHFTITTQTHNILNKLVQVADQNAQRNKAGYRFPEQIKLFSSYFRMLAGRGSYEFLQRNLPEALPSLSSVNKNIRKRDSPIIEGVFRYEELLLYLEERNLPLIVSLSEDATRIVGRIQYDARSNQIVGFVLPINEVNGLPIPFTFKARSAEEIASHFTSGNIIS